VYLAVSIQILIVIRVLLRAERSMERAATRHSYEVPMSINVDSGRIWGDSRSHGGAPLNFPPLISGSHYEVLSRIMIVAQRSILSMEFSLLRVLEYLCGDSVEWSGHHCEDSEVHSMLGGVGSGPR